MDSINGVREIKHKKKRMTPTGDSGHSLSTEKKNSVEVIKLLFYFNIFDE